MSEKLDLKVREYFMKAKSLYDDTRSEFVNILITGAHGSGKTECIATAPKPIQLDCFDTGGTETAALQPLIKSGDLIVTDFSGDDWKNPKEFNRWDKTMQERINMGFFNHIGTFAVDSATNWVIFLMHEIMRVGIPQQKVGGYTGGTPHKAHYLQQQLKAANILRGIIMPLPCHTIFTAHIHKAQDGITGGFVASLLMWGKIATQFPILFDERYIMQVKQDVYKLQVHGDGFYDAGTRIGGKGKFDKLMEPDIRALLKKAGKSWQDKPRLFTAEEYQEYRKDKEVSDV